MMLSSWNEVEEVAAVDCYLAMVGDVSGGPIMYFDGRGGLQGLTLHLGVRDREVDHLTTNNVTQLDSHDEVEYIISLRF